MPEQDQEDAKSAVDISIVLGYLATKDAETLDKKIAVLTQLGYSNNDMAKICRASAGVVRAVKSRIKKAK